MTTPRSQFLKNDVSMTMPVRRTSVRTTPAVHSRIREKRRMMSALLKRLADAEVHSPPACLRNSVHQQPGNRVELVADVESKRTEWSLVAEARAHGMAEVAEVDVPAVRPHGAGVVEQHGPQAAVDRRAGFGRELEHAFAAHRQSADERTELVAAPASDARGAAEEELARERDGGRVGRRRRDVAELRAIGPRESRSDGQIVPCLRRDLRKFERTGQQAAR